MQRRRNNDTYEEMDLNYVAGDGVEENLEYALSNLLGIRWT